MNNNDEAAKQKWEVVKYMKEISTIEFKDADSDEDCVAIIRSSAGKVALALSIRNNGDTEVVLSDADAQKLLQALQVALDRA